MSQPKMPPELRARLEAMLHSENELERRHARDALAGKLKPIPQVIRPPALMTPVSNPVIQPSSQIITAQPCGGCGNSQGPQKVER